MQKSLALIDQLIELAKAQDMKWKEIHQAMHKSSQTIGDGPMVFHLQALKELVKEESQPKTWFPFTNIIMGTGTCSKCKTNCYDSKCPTCGGYVSLL